MRAADAQEHWPPFRPDRVSHSGRLRARAVERCQSVLVLGCQFDGHLRDAPAHGVTDRTTGRP